ncbi:MAG: hypothetical protein ABI051_15160 [Vicinamibacterales bacterium]
MTETDPLQSFPSEHVMPPGAGMGDEGPIDPLELFDPEPVRSTPPVVLRSPAVQPVAPPVQRPVPDPVPRAAFIAPRTPPAPVAQLRRFDLSRSPARLAIAVALSLGLGVLAGHAALRSWLTAPSVSTAQGEPHRAEPVRPSSAASRPVTRADIPHEIPRPRPEPQSVTPSPTPRPVRQEPVLVDKRPTPPVPSSLSSQRPPVATVRPAPPPPRAERRPELPVTNAAIPGIGSSAMVALPPPAAGIPTPEAAPRRAADVGTEPPSGVSRGAELTVAARDRQNVELVLERYRSALSQLDAPKAAAVWPAVNVKTLERAFQQLDTQQLQFDGCNVSVAGSHATASCRGTAHYVPKVGNKTPRTESRTWAFTLQQSGERWVIQRVESR